MVHGYIRTLIGQRLQERTRSDEHPTGINYMDNLLTVSTHSHSHPGRFWNLAPELGLGNFGFGTFSPALTAHYADQFADTIWAALSNMQPARFGWSIVDNFDPDGLIHRDRRPQSPKLIDDRMLVWRVDDIDGQPLTALVNFAIHGTVVEESWLTGDAPGAVERALTDALSARAGRKVPVFFVNGNAGDAEPSTVAMVAQPRGQLQTLGRRITPIFENAWNEIKTKSDVELKWLSQRIPLTYERIGYDGSVLEFSGAGVVYRFGGIFCAGGLAEDPVVVEKELVCSVEGDAQGYPMPNLHKTVLSALRIDDLVVTTLPGEATAGIGLRLAKQVESLAAANGQSIRAMNFGYAQDYLLYFLEKEDWFKGGYEANSNFFGWRLGTHLVEQSKALASRLLTDAQPEQPNGLKPLWWTGLVDDSITPTSSPISPSVLPDEFSDEITRGHIARITWAGGHPGYDNPRVTLEVQGADGVFRAARRESGLVFDNDGYESMLFYRGDYADDHTWALHWDFGFQMPIGTYRFKIQGGALTPEPTSYMIVSPSMELKPAQLTVHEGGHADGTLTLVLSYPDMPTNDDGQSPFKERIPSGYLLRHQLDLVVTDEASPYAFWLGPPLADGDITVQQDGRPVDESPIVTRRVYPRTFATSRAEDGSEVFHTVQTAGH